MSHPIIAGIGFELHNCDAGTLIDEFSSGRTARVAAVIADPPYGKTRCKWDNAIPSDLMWELIGTASTRSAPVILTAIQPFTSRLILDSKVRFRYDLIWEKTEATGHLNAKRQPLRAHEHILVFCDAATPYYPQKTSGHQRKTAVRVNRADRQSQVYGAQRGITSYDSTERYPRSVLKFSTDKQRISLHPTQKPVALMEWIVRTYTKPGDTVLDFCMGSGTTGVACLNTGRNFIGAEPDGGYFHDAANRILQHAQAAA